MHARLLAFPYPPANFAAQISLPDLPASEILYPSEYPVSETDRPGTGHRSWPAQVHSAQILYQWYGWPWVGYHISLRIILVYECTANVVYFDGVQLFNTYAINNDRRIKKYGRVTMDKPAFLKKLCEYGIDTNIVCFNDSAKDDVFCVINNYGYT